MSAAPAPASRASSSPWSSPSSASSASSAYSHLLSVARHVPRILRRLLLSGPASRGFAVTFEDRAAATQVFIEGRGRLTTDRTLACMEPDHISYGVLLNASTGEVGARLAMDNRGVTCDKKAHIATGHLRDHTWCTPTPCTFPSVHC